MRCRNQKGEECKRGDTDGCDKLSPCDKKCCKHSRTGWGALGASTRNERTFSQSAAEPLVHSIPGGCECPDSLYDDANEVWSHAHWSPGSGEMSASPGSQRSLRTGLSILGVLRPPQHWLIWRKMPHECEGNFLHVSAATTKTLLHSARTTGFARIHECRTL